MTGDSAKLILSADDDEDAHFLLKRAFTRAGISTALLQVNDGAEVIRYLSGEGEYANRKEFPVPQLLLLDLKMPRVSGFGVLEFLRTRPEFASIPAIIFSSSNNPEDVRRTQELGCYSYIVKPTDFEKLREIVQALELEFFGPDSSITSPRATGRLASFSAAFTINGPSHGGEGPVQTSENPLNSPHMFKLLVEQVKDYAIFLLDPGGKIMSWNEGARRIKGYEASEIIGKHFSIFYPRQDIDSEKPSFELRVAREIGRFEEEGWRLRKDGTRFWANVLITAIRGENGELTGFSKVTRDLTQRKTHEDNLHRLLDSEERFRLLVEQVKDYAIFMLDAKGNIASWNLGAKRIKGYSPEEIIGKHFSTFYIPEDIASNKPARELQIAIQEGRYEEEGWRLRKDGTRFWANVVITPVWDRRGNLSGFAKVTRDLTLRKRQEEALRLRTEELEAFAHTLSHDLRSPLRSILSFSQILRQEGASLTEEERTTYFARIESSAELMDNLITAILNLSRLSLDSSGEAPIDLRDVIEEAMRHAEGEIQRTGARITVKDPLPKVRANRTLLLQVFSNLITNAVKFAALGKAPDVEIFATSLDKHCEVHVKDHGIGIPQEYQSTIFDIFNRGAITEGSSGTGIGLAIVKRAIRRIGGDITVQSKVGHGSDFVVSLPYEAQGTHHDLALAG